MKKLSVAVATYNEEEYLGRCLSSVREIAYEIVVVDGGSTDKTVEIARQYNAKIIQTENPVMFHINKQKAMDACTGDWILQLDADEEVPPALRQEIKKVIEMSQGDLHERKISPRQSGLFYRHQSLLSNLSNKKTNDIVAFYVPRRNYFLGKPMTYAGMYPDGVIRLVKNGFARFPSKSVHEQIEVDGSVSWLTQDILHYSNMTMERYRTGAQRYIGLLASDLAKSDMKPSISIAILYCFIKPLQTFFILYFRHKGILDGWRGFLFSLFSSVHFPLAYLRFRQGVL